MKKFIMAVDSLANSFSMVDCLSDIRLKYSSDNNPDICNVLNSGDTILIYYKNDINTVNSEFCVADKKDDDITFKKLFEFSMGVSVGEELAYKLRNTDLLELENTQYESIRKKLIESNFTNVNGQEMTVIVPDVELNEEDFLKWLYQLDLGENSKNSISYLLRSLPSSLGINSVFQNKTIADFDEYRQKIENDPYYQKVGPSVGNRAISQALSKYREYLLDRTDVLYVKLTDILKIWYSQQSGQMAIEQLFSSFGFKYGKTIIEQGISICDLLIRAGIDTQNEPYINQGINLYRAIRFFDTGISLEEVSPSVKLIFNCKIIPEYKLNRIIFGAPGTGKSHELNKYKNDLLKLCGGECDRVTFHPDYSYANFVGTYKPVPKGNEISYEYVAGPFVNVLVKALKSNMEGKEEAFVLLIEEINRANVAAVFGEVFQLLDRNSDGFSEYGITPSKDMKDYIAQELNMNPDEITEIRIPNNMFIWATMNSADQGVFPMDTAFKRRWDFEYIGIDEGENKPDVKEILDNANFVVAGKKLNWNNLRKAINNHLSALNVNEDKLMGPFFINLDFLKTADDEAFLKMFKSKVLMYLFEDAAKQKRNTFFAGEGNRRYSELCDAFETSGTDIFADKDNKYKYDKAVV